MSTFPESSRPASGRPSLLIIFLGLFAFPASGLAGDDSTTGNEVSRDRRLGPLKDLNGYFPFEPPESTTAWKERAEAVRRRILVATGLWPMPERRPVRATIHGKVEREGYTVEKVFFESSPGLYVTGSLYRPAPASGLRPAVLSPHGHWGGGRFHDHGESGVEREIASGAEKFARGGRHPLQARCVQLARMGCVVFLYDMLGYADSAPIGMVAHRLSKQRPELSSPDRWGLFSAQSELRLISALGLQTWNSLRALDWLSGLDDVDAKRIGMTGASGGGTQTFILSAIDDRLAASFPAVMVSTAMQGGCTCENATYLRIGTGNVEFAALFAPRPLGLTAANDWTREMPTKGFPQLREHYELLGAPQNFVGEYYDFGHNYNAVSRALMYEHMNRHLKLGAEAPRRERDYEPLSRDEASVWNDEHPKPAMDADAEVAVLRAVARRQRRQVDALTPSDPASLVAYRRVLEGALGTMVGRTLPPAGVVELVPGGDDGATLHVVHAARGERLPAVWLEASSPSSNGTSETKGNARIVVWPTARGTAGLFTDAGEVRPEVQAILDSGAAILSADLLYQGSFVEDGEAVERSRRVANEREFAGYTLGYNHPLFCQRVHDVLSLIACARDLSGDGGQVHLVGEPGAAHWCAVAAALARDSLASVTVDTEAYRFATITDIRDPDLFPGAVKYGDLPAFLSLVAPTPLHLAGENRRGRDHVSRVYAAAKASGHLEAAGDGDIGSLARDLARRLDD